MGEMYVKFDKSLTKKHRLLLGIKEETMANCFTASKIGNYKVFCIPKFGMFILKLVLFCELRVLANTFSSNIKYARVHSIFHRR